MKTLYVSDLDGTLLRSDEKLSDFACNKINELVNNGLLFSYATARSFYSASIVTKGLIAQIPVVTYNGAIIIDNKTKKILLANYFNKKEVRYLIDDLMDSGIYPVVYTHKEDKEVFSYLSNQINEDLKKFLISKNKDERKNIVTNIDDLYDGDIFHILCIDKKEKLELAYNKYKDIYTCFFQKDMYLHNYWLEIYPKNVSKAKAVKKLKEYLLCDEVVCFGDGKNDIEMFRFADRAYAVINANQELKQYATDIIGSNENDSVVKFLIDEFEK